MLLTHLQKYHDHLYFECKVVSLWWFCSVVHGWFLRSFKFITRSSPQNFRWIVIKFWAGTFRWIWTCWKGTKIPVIMFLQFFCRSLKRHVFYPMIVNAVWCFGSHSILISSSCDFKNVWSYFWTDAVMYWFYLHSSVCNILKRRSGFDGFHHAEILVLLCPRWIGSKNSLRMVYRIRCLVEAAGRRRERWQNSRF